MTVAALQLKPKDVTAPLRARRYRQKKNRKETNASVSVRPERSVTVSAPEMCALAARLSDGRATAADLRLAERIIMTFVEQVAARFKHLRAITSTDRGGITPPATRPAARKDKSI